LLDKVVVNATVSEVSTYSTYRRPHGQAQQRHEKDEPEQHPPKGAIKRPVDCSEMHNLARLRLFIALGPGRGSLIAVNRAGRELWRLVSGLEQVRKDSAGDAQTEDRAAHENEDYRPNLRIRISSTTIDIFCIRISMVFEFHRGGMDLAHPVRSNYLGIDHRSPVAGRGLEPVLAF
jgi:hypothetical protein